MIFINKIFRKLCRSVAKSAFVPNHLRIAFLKGTGMSIGKDVVINEGFSLVCDIGFEENICIGDRVAVASNVSLIATSHPNNSKLRTSSAEYPFMEVFGSIQIQHDSWLGAGVIVLPNVSVGPCSVVGAGAVVTNDVPENSVVAGVPAKLIRGMNIQPP